MSANPPLPSKTERLDDWAKRYLAGESLKSIADDYGVHRTTVHATLSRRGISRAAGSKQARRLGAQRERRRAVIETAFGHSLETHERLLGAWGGSANKDNPLVRYYEQRAGALRRGIAWEISFAEWWAFWERSGKWSERGHGAGGYCMGRLHDVGPYKLGNVYICTNSENLHDQSWNFAAAIRDKTRREQVE